MKKFSGGKTLAIAAVAGGAILASVAPVMADVSAQSPSAGLIRVESPAKLKAWGAAIEVKVTYTCPVGTQSSLNLVVNQAKLGGVAIGGAYQSNLNCNGAFETVTLNVQANDRAFGLGKAFAKAEIQGYPNVGAKDEREISIGL
ncbi:hypothetical protein ABZ345_30595 [Lentzea sp. NPDC005914]|uniref:hypothetical protein n=1 Tax=Lentzea sp. NPDC005914 TaxID=3154572 RepID=UPI0033DE14E3